MPSKKPVKPKKKYPVEKMYDFHECMEYIKKKYGVDYDNRDHMDDEDKEDLCGDSLWLWLCDNRGDTLNRDGCVISLQTHPDWIEEDMSDHLKMLCGLIHKEFAEDSEDECTEFWCSW